MLELIGTLTGIFTSVIALAVSVWVFKGEKQLSINSVRPLLNAFYGSHKDNVYVRIGNYGMGPAIIEEVKFYSCNCEDGSRDRDIEDPSLAHYVLGKARQEGVDIGPFFDYVPIDALEQRAIAPDGELFLVKYRSRDPEKCDFVKRALADVRLKITYRDIFKRLQEDVCVRDCSPLGCITCDNEDEPDLCQEY